MSSDSDRIAVAHVLTLMQAHIEDMLATARIDADQYEGHGVGMYEAGRAKALGDVLDWIGDHPSVKDHERIQSKS